MNDYKSQILVVDDEPVNLQLVKEILKNKYRLSFATNGLQAIEVAKKIHPDLILLDIMMPEIDGYETCSRLKADPDTEKVPVIFFSALDGEEDEALGFQVGGVDFITKPARPVILEARVRTHLDLKGARDELIKQNEILRENESLRNDIDGIIRHDLKGPLMGMINFPKLVLKNCHLPEKYQKFLNDTIHLAFKMLDMINLSLDLYKMEKGIYDFQPSSISILPIIEDILAENHTLVKYRELSVSIRLQDEPLIRGDEFKLSGDHLLTYSMLSNIIKNALEASPEKGQIKITLEKRDRIHIHIYNQGAVPEGIRDRFFEKFVTAGKKQGTGLGTYSAKLIAETQRGTVHLNTSQSDGTTVSFSFPV